MKEYKNYHLNDFLLDPEFRGWVIGDEQISTSERWNEIATLYPHIEPVMRQAREMILTWNEDASSLTDNELEFQVQRILSSTAASPVTSDLRPTVPIWKKWSIAASIAAIVGISWFFTLQKGNDNPDTYEEFRMSLSESAQEVVNHESKPLPVDLPDGSRITLEPNSKISFSKPFVEDHKREIYLSGKAFFEVKKDKTNPFYVYANGLLTRVVGTSFYVQTTEKGTEVIVTCGKVTVAPLNSDDTEPDHEVILTPNQQAVYSSEENHISKGIVATPRVIDNVEPKMEFNFDNQPISQVFASLEKVYGIPIRYDKSQLEKCFLTVKLSDEPFFTKLDIVIQTIGASYQVKKGEVIVTGKGCEQYISN